jgi:HD-like signal output (HDOD) protein
VLAQHSWITGTMASALARHESLGNKMIDQCFLAGLLHDVGQMVLAFGLPAEYAQVSARAKNEHLPLWQVEQQCFGATHADVGAYLLALWGLPNPVVEAVALHHQPDRSTTPEFSSAVAVHVADVFAHDFMSSNTEVPPPILDLAYLTRLGLEGRMESWQEDCQIISET